MNTLETMGKQTAKDVILERRFGPLEDGRCRESVESEFGEPVDHVVSKPWYVTYGNGEVKYDDRRVEGFSLYLNESGKIDFESYLSCGNRLSLENFPDWCRAHSLKYIKDHYLSFQDALFYALSNDVYVKFLDGTLTVISVEPEGSNSFEELLDDEEHRPFFE